MGIIEIYEMLIQKIEDVILEWDEDFGNITDQYLEDREAIRAAHEKYIDKMYKIKMEKLKNKYGWKKAPLVNPSKDIVSIHK
jgi:hypothetical protein